MSSETPADLNLAALETSETPAADILIAVSSLLTHLRNRLKIENFFHPKPNFPVEPPTKC